MYKSYWNFIRTEIESVTLKEISEEEFNSADTNFNIPKIGKLYVEYDKIERYRKKLKAREDAKAKKNQASRQSGTGD